MKDLFEPQLTGEDYVQAMPRPQQQELDIFYRELYYRQGVTDTYHVSYSDDELKQKRLRADCVVELLAQNFGKKETVDFLEVGCGEGFVLSSAVAKGWNVSGVDYQSAPVQAFNPAMVPRISATDPNVYLNDLIERGVKKDVLVLQNELEHVLHPQQLLRKLQQLLTENGCLLVQVPNDFSDLQALAKQQGRINRDYWFHPPQHLNYFNEKNLPGVARSCGFELIDGISDFPIEMYLWGNTENYVTDKTQGKYAHQARVSLDLFISRNGLDKYLQFYRAAFQIGVGRNICAVLKKLPAGR
jgi:2-polyprenyl-3-methyl-5-hydroxy-6-metoxy-1,4-benzoquinol methylase